MHAVRRCACLQAELAACKTLAIIKGCLPTGRHTGCPLLAKMEEIFLVHYDKSEVDSGSRCGYSDTIPESFDAEVLGVYLQRSNANRCARDKVAELRDGGSEYFEETGPDPKFAFAWEGTADDVGRSITDRVYVERHAIGDPLPTKRARTATDTSFDSVAPFLREIKQDQLVAMIGMAWDESPALRDAAEKATQNTWRTTDIMTMFQHDWECGRDRILLKATPRDGELRVGRMWTTSRKEFHETCWNEGECVHTDDDGGCEECAGGSTARLTVKTNRRGQLILVAETNVMCACMSYDGHHECVETNQRVFKPIAAGAAGEPKRKTKRKAR